MHRSSNYSYQQTSSSRSSNHGTSSAFSPNANPNEDWTKISDLAERRRIQNRIAQRNYRKKLKRRLEDLEKRAATASTSPERSHEGSESPKAVVHTVKSRTKQARTTKSSSDATRHTSAQRGSSYDSHSTQEDRGSSMFSQQCTRQLSASPPPVFSYPSYSHLESYGHHSYGQPPSYHSLNNHYNDLPYGEYGTTLPSILPGPILGSGAKKHHSYADDEIVSPFSMSYASMAGIDLGPTPQHLPEHNIPMPPLSSVYSDDHSSPSTPAEPLLGCPLTPKSDPCSPHSYSLF